MENNQNLYFIDANKNDKFSCLRGNDLQQLLNEIESFKLTYRDTLNLKENVTFGVEIEYENVLKQIVDLFVHTNIPNWNSKEDGSLAIGGEISSAILRDNNTSWNELKKICKFLKKTNANTFENAGGHIHIGMDIIGGNIENWKKFLKLYAAYESVIYRFAYNDKINGRKKIYKFAKPVADDIVALINNLQEFSQIKELTPERYSGINLGHVRLYDIQTVEFRCPNATIEEVIWQNNINTFTKLMASPKLKIYDEEFVEYKLKNERISSRYDKYMYNIVCLKNALEFVDLVFDNNLDKIYFLRQYIKGFQEAYKTGTTIKSKKFVK